MSDKKKTLKTLYEPPPELKPYIQNYWVISLPDSCPHDIHITGSLPGVDLIFNFSEPVYCSVDNSPPVLCRKDFLVGSMARRTLIRPTGATSLFGIKFTFGGLYPFLSMPPVDLSDLCIELEEVWELFGLGISQIMEKTPPEPGHLIEAFENFFSQRMCRFREHSRDVEQAVNIIRRRQGQIPVNELVTKLQLTRRQLERKFTKRIGVPPKKLCRIFRIKHVLLGLEAARHDSASLAVSNGFFDQAHLIHEFRLFTGTSPLNYLKEQMP